MVSPPAQRARSWAAGPRTRDATAQRGRTPGPARPAGLPRRAPIPSSAGPSSVALIAASQFRLYALPRSLFEGDVEFVVVAAGSAGAPGIVPVVPEVIV